MDVVLVTGGFDPLHSGHLAYFKAAKELGDKLVVGINSDEWLTRKKGKPFMPFSERAEIIKGLSIVDQIISFDDSDDTACGAIYKTLATHGDIKIIFANGGDRTDANIPEMSTYESTRYVDFVFGVGGEDKKNSSSWILDEWKTQKTLRQWGYWRVLDDKGTVKTKELVIEPGKSLSDQRHFHRSEHWYVLSGRLQIELEFANGEKQLQVLNPHTTYIIREGVWHRPFNDGEEPVHIVEIQYGEKCVEEDIERRT